MTVVKPHLVEVTNERHTTERNLAKPQQVTACASIGRKKSISIITYRGVDVWVDAVVVEARLGVEVVNHAGLSAAVSCYPKGQPAKGHPISQKSEMGGGYTTESEVAGLYAKKRWNSSTGAHCLKLASCKYS